MNIERNIEYSVAIYIRLSKEDGDKEESESVTNQRKILRAGCSHEVINEKRQESHYQKSVTTRGCCIKSHRIF